MTRTSPAIRLFVAFVAALAMIGFSAAGSNAQSAGEAKITIHKASCPDGTGANIFEKCHGNALAGVRFDIDGNEVTTGSNGHATATVDAGTITVIEDAGDFADFVGARVFCSEQDSQKVLIDAAAPKGSVSFKAGDGDDIVCDWYNLTAGVATAVPTKSATSVPSTTKTPTITLPNTGAGERDSGSNGMLLMAGTLLTVVGAAFVLRKRQLS